MADESLHGACPIFGEDSLKWGANLWVWNRARYGLYPTNQVGADTPAANSANVGPVPCNIVCLVTG